MKKKLLGLFNIKTSPKKETETEEEETDSISEYIPRQSVSTILNNPISKKVS